MLIAQYLLGADLSAHVAST